MPIPGYESTHLITLDDLKNYLNIPLTDTSSDAELTAMRDAAETYCETYTGRSLRQQTVTEYLNGDGTPFLTLHNIPIVSITSVTEMGNAVATTDFAADLERGILARTIGTYYPTWWLPGYRTVTVVYEAGYSGSTVAPDLQQAVLAVAREFWESQRGNLPAVVGQENSEWAKDTRYLSMSVPREAQMVLDRYRYLGMA